MNKTIRKVIKNYINEYYADQRLPFDDDFYGKKNQMEQYVDWLEDFGKYGNLPPSTLDFKEEIIKAIDKILDGKLHGSYTASIPNTKEEVLKRLEETMFKHLKFNKDGNLYVERSIDLPKKASFVSELYHSLIDDFQNNVGGCWSYRKGFSNVYCSSYGFGTKAVLKGFIRTDDIDFIKTVLLNFHYTDEFEIRVKPFATIALNSFSIEKYTHNFKNPLLVSATYFGNGGKYNGEYANIDDGFGNFTPINRKGEIIKIPDGCHFDGQTNVGLIAIKKPITNEYGNISYIYNFIRPNGETISDTWFDSISYNWFDGYSLVMKKEGLFDYKFNYIDANGNFLSEKWFDEASHFNNGIASVCPNGIDNGINIINTEGKFLSEYPLNEVDFEYDEHSVFVQRLSDMLCNLINKKNAFKGGYVSNKWFDYIFKTNIQGLYKVQIHEENNDEARFNYLTKDGRLLSNTDFCGASSKFINGYTVVKYDFHGRAHIMDVNGNIKETEFDSIAKANLYLSSLSENTIFKSSVRKVLDEIRALKKNKKIKET